MKKTIKLFVLTVLAVMAFGSVTAQAYDETIVPSDIAKTLLETGTYEISYVDSVATAMEIRHDVMEYVDAYSVESQTPNVKAAIGRNTNRLVLTLERTGADFTADELAAINAEAGEGVTSINDYICANIAYDENAAKTGGLRVDSSCAMGKTALNSGLGICQGYANAFAALADAQGYEVIKVRGYTDGSYHVVNAVRIDGVIYIIDCVCNDNSDNATLMVSYQRYAKMVNFEASIDIELAFAVKYGA